MTTNQWTQGYTYDRFGNRTGVTKTGTITYTDGLASLSFTDGAGKVRTNRVTTAGYTYDEAGNLTRGQSDGSTWQRYQYDAAGRLACTKDDSSVLLADYTYGASNHRLKQTEYGSGGGTCYYAWDGNSIIAEFSDTGSALSWTKSYVFLGGRLLATPTPGGTTYHHPDRLGTRLVTGETNGIVAAEQTTLPYGTALDIESMNTPTNRRFTSYDRSQKTKLDYAVNRFYNACQGRFTQVDPIEMQAASLENPQTLNLYAYVGNDPINRIDPEGLGWLGKIFRFLAKIATAALVAVVLLTLPGWGVSLLLLGIAGLTGLAGWHNGKLGEIAGQILSFGAYRPNFRTPSFNGSGVSGVNNFLATQQNNSAKQLLADYLANPQKLVNEVFNKFGSKIKKCVDEFNKRFGTAVDVPTVSTAPKLDLSATGEQLAVHAPEAFKALRGAHSKLKAVRGIPDFRRNTIYLAKERFSASNASVAEVSGLYIHELGNFLGYKASGPRNDPYTWGDPRGVGSARDTDSGANFQRCVTGRIDF